ncbi:uncharacterized protein LOC134191676 [Corticium candelabrum]|uniref:uncharacterized protein LOC134191676 n=1 Tax=Corticium candelabrum TaxID=121492 RepID=UPI002E258B6D|nr:uncharacterized protein LOC134191676 [Corticium candelabrum]
MKEFDKCFWEIQTPLGMLMQLSFLSSDDQKLIGNLKLWFLQYNSDGAIVSSSFQWWPQGDPYFLYENTNATLVIQVPAANLSIVTLKCEFFSAIVPFSPCDFDKDKCGWDISDTVWQRFYSGML